VIDRDDKKTLGTSVADGVYQVNKLVHSAEPAVIRASAGLVTGASIVMKLVGQGVGAVARIGADWSGARAARAPGNGAKLALRGVQVVFKTAQFLGGATRELGGAIQPAAPAIGAAIGGATSGVTTAVSGAVDAVVLSEAVIADLQNRLEKSSVALRERARRRHAAILLAQQENKRTELLDLLVVGGVSLLSLVRDPDRVTREIESAFRQAYPGLSENGETFADVVDRLDAEGLIGFASAIKGKLFEQRFVDHLNTGNLPEGYQAVLASSPNQPGFDIQILDENGVVSELLQAKATDSVGYVQDALQRYPEIDVVTTTEVYSDLVAVGASNRIIDSGISDVALEQKVESAITSSGAAGTIDWLPQGVGLAVIALSCFMSGSASLDQRSREFGVRGAKAGLSTWISGSAAIATQTWWLGVASGLGAQWLASKGANRRRQLEALRALVKTMEAKTARQYEHALDSQPVS
jgi:hypothetical protein